jgi:hypothetical protein
MSESREQLLEAASKVAEALELLASGKLPSEIYVLDTETIGIAVEVDGVDYMLTMINIPRQRARPVSN